MKTIKSVDCTSLTAPTLRDLAVKISDWASENSITRDDWIDATFTHDGVKASVLIVFGKTKYISDLNPNKNPKKVPEPDFVPLTEDEIDEF